MIQIVFTPAEIDQLYEARTNHPHPRVRQMMEVLYPLVSGKSGLTKSLEQKLRLLWQNGD